MLSSTPDLFDLPEDVFPDVTSEKLAQVFLNGLWRRLHVQNFSLLLCLWGSHRSGKSLSGISLGYLLDSTFEKELESRIIYDAESLTKGFQDIRRRRIRGACFILDEGGAGDFSSAFWYENIAKIASAEMQACGWLNPLLISISQNPNFLSVTIRRLSQGLFQCERTGTLYSTIRPYFCAGNPWAKNSHRRFPVISSQRPDGTKGNIYKICRIIITLPPKDIIQRYEAVSQDWKDRLLADSVANIQALNQGKNKKNATGKNIEEIINEVVQNYDSYVARSRKDGTQKFLSKEIIRYRHKVTDHEARLIQELSQKKHDKENS